MIATTKTRPRRGVKATIAGLALAALATAGATTAAPAVAAEHTATSSVATLDTAGVRIGSAPAAAAGVHLASAQSAAAAAVPTPKWVYAKVDGARLRAFPTTGLVLRLIPLNTRFLVFCMRFISADVHTWGYAEYAGARGWVRSDLWQPVNQWPRIC